MKHYSLFIKGQVGARKQGERKQGNIVYGRYYTNISLRWLIRSLADRMVPGLNLANEQFIVQTNDSSKLDYVKGKQKFEDWETDNLYSYETSVPIEQSKLLDTYMLEDMNRYSDFTGRVEKRKVKCFVLKTVPGKEKLLGELLTKGKAANTSADADSVVVSNTSLYTLCRILNYEIRKDFPVLDETGYSRMHQIDIKINAGINDYKGICAALQKHGLDLIETERELEYFILTEKGYKSKDI
jgi:hypothetical protein